MRTNFKFLVALTASLAIGTAYASSAKRLFQDIKLPTQKMVEKQTITNPAAAGTADILSGNAGNTSTAAATVSTFVAQPDVPRNLVITPGGSTSNVASCTIVVAGTNYFGRAISEDFVFADNASTATTGAKAFKTVSSVTFPANCEDIAYGATWSIGYGEKIGISRCLDNAGDIFFSLLNGSKEATAPTMVVDADEVEKNTADYNGTMNGSNDFNLYFMQNFRCTP